MPAGALLVSVLSLPMGGGSSAATRLGRVVHLDYGGVCR